MRLFTCVFIALGSLVPYAYAKCLTTVSIEATLDGEAIRGVEITIDGRYIGQTPCDIQLTPGKHRVELFADEVWVENPEMTLVVQGFLPPRLIQPDFVPRHR